MTRQLPAHLEERLPAAAGVFAASGFDGARVDDLAEATGIPKATLYYYFDGKRDVLTHLLRRVLDMLAERVTAAVDGTGTAEERLVGAIWAQYEVMTKHRDECLVLLAELGHLGRLPEIASMVRQAFHQPMEKLLEAGAQDGSLRRVADVPLAASALFGGVTMTALHQLVDGHELTPATAGSLTTMILDGLRP